MFLCSATLRRFTLAALVVGLLGMHHLVMGGSCRHDTCHDTAHVPPAATVVTSQVAPAGPTVLRPHAPPGPADGQDLLHVCLAVLVAAGALAIRWVFRRVVVWKVREPVRSAVAGGGTRPALVRRPADRLSALCVLRL